MPMASHHLHVRRYRAIVARQLAAASGDAGRAPLPPGRSALWRCSPGAVLFVLHAYRASFCLSVSAYALASARVCSRARSYSPGALLAARDVWIHFGMGLRGTKRGRGLLLPSARGPTTGHCTASPIRSLCFIVFVKAPFGTAFVAFYAATALTWTAWGSSSVRLSLPASIL
jgi:hypothetical protein